MSAKRQTDDDATSTGNVTGNDRATKKPRLVEGWSSVTQYFTSMLLPVNRNSESPRSNNNGEC